MGRHAERSYLIDLVNQSYIDQEKTVIFVQNLIAYFAKESKILMENCEKKNFMQKMQILRSGL